MSLSQQSTVRDDESVLPEGPAEETAMQLNGQIAVLLRELHACKTSLMDMVQETAGAKPRSSLQRILVKTRGKYVVLRTPDIDWIEAWGDYVRLHSRGAVYIHRHTIGEFDAQLDPEQFIRIGRSAIVNIDRIKELEPMNHGDYLVILADATQLNLSRHYRENLSAIFDHQL